MEEFLGLSTKESEYIELKLALSQTLTKRRKQIKKDPGTISQDAASQSRVAKIEKKALGVSVDLLVKSLLAMGANKKSIAKAIA